MFQTLTEQLMRAKPLSAEQVADAVNALVADDSSVAAKAEFLTALARKGETADEIAAFARELRARAVQPTLDAETRAREILDVCGTGGDRLGTFNISTTVALICAAAGVTVAKHGNRAITSHAGSADVLEALGVRIDLSPEEAARALREQHFAFFFAPNYHPAFKRIAPARKLCAERSQRTIFNFLGPLLNPVRPSAQLIGVPQPQLCEPIARVLQSLGARRGMVVCGCVVESPKSKVQSPESEVESRGDHASRITHHASLYLDELSTLGENTIAEFYQERGLATSVMALEHFSLQPATLADLRGSDRATNAMIVRELLSGRERGPKRDAVLLNTAAALLVAGQVRTLAAGWDSAAELLDSGRALRKLEELAGV